MRGIQTEVILDLYNVRTLPSLLNNAESWILTKKDEQRLDSIGIRAMKRLFGLPTTSPNVVVMFLFGLLYKAQEIDNKAGYTANTSRGRVGRGGNADFSTFRLVLTNGPTDGRTKPLIESLVRD